MSIEKRINQLRPPFNKIASTMLHIWRDDLLIDVRILETLRTRERQAALEASGKSRIKVGWHNFGLALDFGVFADGVYITDGTDRAYERCGLIAEALNCTWGGRWTRFPDYGHIEFHPDGCTLQMFLNGQRGGLVA